MAGEPPEKRNWKELNWIILSNWTSQAQKKGLPDFIWLNQLIFPGLARKKELPSAGRITVLAWFWSLFWLIPGSFRIPFWVHYGSPFGGPLWAEHKGKQRVLELLGPPERLYFGSISGSVLEPFRHPFFGHSWGTFIPSRRKEISFFQPIGQLGGQEKKIQKI